MSAIIEIVDVESGPPPLPDDGALFQPHKYPRTLVLLPPSEQQGTTSRSYSPYGPEVSQEGIETISSHFVPRPSDIWLVSYPQSGLTWLSAIVSHLLFDESQAAASGGGISLGRTLNERVLNLEVLCSAHPGPASDPLSALSYVNGLPTTKRRIFRSHSPLPLISSWTTFGNKVVYLSRNPKDVSVALWFRSLAPLSLRPSPVYDGPFSHFLSRIFLKGHASGGDWYSHVLPYVHTSNWQSFAESGDGGAASLATRRDAPAGGAPGVLKADLFHLWYEAFAASPSEGVFGVGEFIGCKASELSKTRCRAISELTALSAMQEEEKRKGVVGWGTASASKEGGGADKEVKKGSVLAMGGVGGWKDFFTVRQNESFDAIHEKKIKSWRAEGLLRVDFDQSNCTKNQVDEIDIFNQALESGENVKTCRVM